MAAGLPVVTNVAGDCADIVTGVNAGFTAAPGSAEALARALRAAEALDPARRAQMGASGRAYVAEHYNRDRLVHRLVDVRAAPVTGR